MSSRPCISIVIPCFNEETAIPVVLDKITQAGQQTGLIAEIIVVNDGSSDGSAKLLQARSDIQVLHSVVSEGYGGALKKGFAQARGEYVLFMDMDDTYQISDMQRMLEHLEQKNLAVVFGNRLAQQSGMPAIRMVGNKFYHYCLRAFSLPPLEDPCTGMRLFRRELIADFCSLPQNDLSYSMALTMHILTAKIKYGEIRITYHERLGESKLNSFLDGWRFLWTILSNRLSA